ncbi:hypothetical protein [Pandoravirus japonicus]|uniref:Uncharacterized protein n=1 Tax=Pandoravirus japonicus TaxID=2823154 RepID=A0A811BQX8_9VIRU|nr:hypothetical protein [Pandoravirus japonicus]
MQIDSQAGLGRSILMWPQPARSSTEFEPADDGLLKSLINRAPIRVARFRPYSSPHPDFAITQPHQLHF